MIAELEKSKRKLGYTFDLFKGVFTNEHDHSTEGSQQYFKWYTSNDIMFCDEEQYCFHLLKFMDLEQDYSSALTEILLQTACG